MPSPTPHPAAPPGSREPPPTSRSPLAPRAHARPSRPYRLLVTTAAAACLVGAAWIHLGPRLPGRPQPGTTTPATSATTAPLGADFSAEARLALAQTDPAGRSAALTRALTAWSATDAPAAFAWARTLHAADRAESIEALARALARQPAEAVALARALIAQDPAGALDEVPVLLAELLRAGAFTEATAIADSAPAATRADWQLAALNAWLNTRPDATAELGAVLAQYPLRGDAFQTLARTWASAAPEQLAAHAVTLPPGPERSFGLQIGLDAWILRDASAAGAWLGQLGDNAEFEHALASLIARTDTLNRPTATALEWAESIADPVLRAQALTHVLREWSSTEKTAAQHYLAATPQLDARERARIAALLDPVAED